MLIMANASRPMVCVARMVTIAGNTGLRLGRHVGCIVGAIGVAVLTTLLSLFLSCGSDSMGDSCTQPASTHCLRPQNIIATPTSTALGRNVPIFIKVPGVVSM